MYIHNISVDSDLNDFLHFSNLSKYLYIFLEIRQSCYIQGWEIILILYNRERLQIKTACPLKMINLTWLKAIYSYSFQFCSINNINASKYFEFSFKEHSL